MEGNRAPLLILGAGYLGARAAKSALMAGRRVMGTTRSRERAQRLEKLGVEVFLCEALDEALLDRLFALQPDVLITFPPDPPVDALVCQKIPLARAAVYISSTGVYGERTGRIDEETPVDLREQKALLRFQAESQYLEKGAVVLRAAAIYGPGRGLHLRVLRGEHRIAEGGARVVSRIHVDDLAELALASLSRGLRGEVFVVADEAPVPQVEVLHWLCERLSVPFPSEVDRNALPETLRHDRSIDSRKILRALQVSLRYPSYKEGFSACLREEQGA